MELRHLKLVRTLAQEGTLTNAGKKLHLSQPALSHQLREIEEEFGAPLFERVKKRMVITQVGRRVLESADTVLGELEKVETDVRCLVLGEGGTLRIATACYTGYHWLPALLKTFRRSHPRVDVRIIIAATSNPIEHMLKGDLDLALLNVRVPEPKINYRKLFDDPMLVLVHRDHPWAARKSVEPESFLDETVVKYDIPDEEIFFFREVLAPARVTPKAVIGLPTTDAIVEMVKADMGVAVMPEWSLKPYLRSSQLKGLRLTRKGIKRPWYVATLKSDHEPPHVRSFIKHLAQSVKC